MSEAITHHINLSYNITMMYINSKAKCLLNLLEVISRPIFVFESCCQRILFLDNYTIDLSPTASNRGATKGEQHTMAAAAF